MPRYKVVEKKLGKITEVTAFSQKQALYKLALEKSKDKREAGKLYAAMLKSHEAVIVNDPNQLEFF
ncbi:MAG TPA: hypothetical protein VI911_10525 [Patescibacteria group bacterium]|nr:hypothetical protein [Patescibacteria group bacterium]